MAYYQEPVQMAVLTVDDVTDLTPGEGTTYDGVRIDRGGIITTNTVNEFTSGAGVTINTVLFKDSAVSTTADSLVIGATQSADVTPPTSGAVIYVADGTEDPANAVMLAHDDGATDQKQSLVAPSSNHNPTDVYTGLTISGGDWTEVSSLTLPAGTYLMGYSMRITTAANTVYWFRVATTVGLTGGVSASKNHTFYQQAASTHISAMFELVVASEATYYLLAKRNTSSGGDMIPMGTVTIDGASYQKNVPILWARRLV